MYGIMLFAFVLRLYRIDAVPLRGDEAFTLQVWTGPLRSVLSEVAPVEPQPPLVFASLRLWVSLTGTSPLAGRYYSVLWSMLTLAPIYRIGRQMGGERTGLLAALLWAISPFQVWHAQDIRNYTLWAAWSTLGVWFLLAALETAKLKHRAAYVLATAVAAYSFYFEVFIIVAHNVYAIWRLRTKPRLLAHWLGTQATLAALLAPWYLQIPRLRSGGYEGTGITLKTTSEVLSAIPDTTRMLLFGETLPASPAWQFLATALALTSLGFALILSARPKKSTSVFLTIYTALPFALFLILSTTGPYYRPRYLNGATAAYTLSLAALVTWLFAKGRKWLSWLTLAALLSLSAAGLANYYFNPDYAKAPNWPALAETLSASVRPDDMIIRNVPDPAFDYYYQSQAKQLTLPASPGASRAETEARLDAVFAETSRVWFIPTDHPVWDPDRTVASSLETNNQLVAETWVDSMQIQLWSPWEVSPEEIIHPTKWVIGAIANLVGFHTLPVTHGEILTLRPGETLTLIVYWEPLANSRQSYTVFTHLMGPQRPDGSTQWAGSDHPPQNGRVDTTIWYPHPTLRDPFTLTMPDDAPAGEYRLNIGMYDPDTGQRVPISDTEGQSYGDTLSLLSITVQP
jgi:hypothetical protein